MKGRGGFDGFGFLNSVFFFFSVRFVCHEAFGRDFGSHMR